MKYTIKQTKIKKNYSRERNSAYNIKNMIRYPIRIEKHYNQSQVMKKLILLKINGH